MDAIATFAETADTGATHSRATYSETHPPIKSGKVTRKGVKRDSDGVPFVEIIREGAEDKPKYQRADHVAAYLRDLARLGDEDQDEKDEGGE